MKKYIFNANALRVSIIFLFFGLIWIYFSDRILLFFTQDIETLREIQTIKGWLFVLITTLLIYVLVSREIEAKNKFIVKLKNAEQDILDSNERLRAISDASSEAFVFSENGFSKEANTKAINMFGYSYDEFIGMMGSDVVAPEFKEIVKKRMIGSYDKPYEALAMRKDGTTFWAEISGQSYIYKGKQMRVTSVKDIDRTKQIEKEKQESEQLFNELFQQINTGVAIYKPLNIDNDFEVVDLNFAGEKLSKVKKNEVKGKKATEAFPEIKKSGLIDVFKRVSQSGKSEEFSLKIYKDDRIEQSLENFAFRLPSGLIVSLFDDTSDKQKAIQRVKESEQKYKTLFMNNSSAYAHHKIITDNKGKPTNYIFLDVNPEFEKQTGLKKEDILNKTVREVLPGIEDYWIQKYGEVAETGVPIDYENYSSDLGKYFETRIYSPQKGYFAVTFYDVSDKVKAVEALKESEQRYILATKASNLGIFDWFTDSREVFYSDLWKQQLGYEPDELENNFDTFEMLLYDDDKAWVLKRVKDYIEKPEGDYSLEFRMKHKKGKYLWIHSRAESLNNDQGKVYRLFGTHRDITARKEAQMELENYKEKLEFMVHERTNELLQANEELNSANEELHVTNEILAERKIDLENTLLKLQKMQAQLVQSEKMASLGILVAGIAHEINNPVNFISSGVSGIKTNINILVEAFNSDEIRNNVRDTQVLNNLEDTIKMLSKALGAIEIGVDRTVTIVKGLKSFARADNNVIELSDIHKLIDNTLLILYNQFKNRISIIKEYGEVPLLEVFVGQMGQMLMNVLSNAIQAIENKGEIKIKTHVENGKLILKIKDNGKGMDEQTRLKIFDPFFTTKSLGKGTGLGLSISYNIIEKHNGSIRVESIEHKGTEFIVELPVKQENTKESLIN